MSQAMVMATRAGRPEHTPEAEPVVIDTDDPKVVKLTLDDGETIEMDRTELEAAIAPPEAS
jgi:hypothetical protein